jgi:hypothetical protein
MRGKQIMFFVDPDDIDPILRQIEDSNNIHYFMTGLLDSATIPQYDTFSQIPDLGYVSEGDWNKIDSYLILPRNTNLNIRSIPQRAGGIKYAVDQMINEKSVVLKPGGIFNNEILVAGRVATISEEKFSVDLYKAFSLIIKKKKFKRIGEFYVGPSALQKLHSGWRLVTNEKLSRGFDLALS